MKPLLIILKTLMIGCLWSIIFIDGIRVFLLINWHFDIFFREHWHFLSIKWNSGESISKSEIFLILTLFLSIPLWFIGWMGLCIIKWKNLLKNIFLGPVYLYRYLTLKTRAPVVVKKKSIAEDTPVIKKTPIIKKTTTKRPQLPSAVIMQNNNYTMQKNNTIGGLSSYQAASKKSPESPSSHALFNFDEDDFDLDFDFEKKDKQENYDDSIPSALVVDEPEIVEAKHIEKKDIEESAEKTMPSQKNRNDNKQNTPTKKDNQQKPHSPQNQTQARESHTPVLDILNQKGYDVIQTAVVKNITIDYIGVSKNQLILCLVDKEIGDWLADEEKFNDEEPLWFSESSHRISPVRQIDIVRDVIKTKLAVADLNFELVSFVVVQSGNIINADEMFEVWNAMNISVTRINRGSPKEIKLFSKTLDICEEKTDKNTFDKLKKVIRSLA